MARAEGDNRNFICINVVGECAQICTNNSECTGNQVCEELRCREPVCMSDADCPGKQCISGSCAPKIEAIAVASCSVEPAFALLNAGKEHEFSILARDISGQVIPYLGEVIWSSEKAQVLGTKTSAVATASDSGHVSINASLEVLHPESNDSIGKIDCQPASAQAYAPPSSGTRVLVVEFHTSKPIPGAQVVSDEHKGSTNNNGWVLFEDLTGSKTISVFHPNYSFVTMADTDSDDLIVYLKKPKDDIGFNGSLKASDFSRLEMLNETVRLAFMGASLSGDLTDINRETLFGEGVPTHLDIGPLNQEVPLPTGAVIGLGNNMFKSDFRLSVAPGLRTLWALGGNASLNELIRVAGPALGGGDLEPGPIADALTPILGKLQIGARLGVQSPTSRSGWSSYEPVSIPMNVLMRLPFTIRVPELPGYELGGSRYAFEGAALVVGALQNQEGMVPLGLSLAGNEGYEAGYPEGASGKLGANGKVPLKMAARHSGLEGRKLMLLARTTRISSLILPLSDSYEPESDVSTGIMQYVGDIPISPYPDFPTEIEMTPTWLRPSNQVTLDTQARTLSFDRVDGATFYRLQIGEHEQEWSLYFPQGSTPEQVLTIPELPEHLSTRDPLSTAPITLHALSTNAGPGVSYKAMVEFNDRNMNNLLPYTSAYVSRKVR